MRHLYLAILGVLLIGACSSAPRYRTVPADDSRPSADRSNIIQVAKSYLNTPYRNGGTSRKGVDCSGFIVAVFKEFSIPLPRTSSAQSTTGKQIALSELEPADLVFFNTSRNKRVSHVGIYIGRGRFIHASTRAYRVRIDRLSDTYFRKRFIFARRVVD